MFHLIHSSHNICIQHRDVQHSTEFSNSMMQLDRVCYSLFFSRVDDVFSDLVIKSIRFLSSEVVTLCGKFKHSKRNQGILYALHFDSLFPILVSFRETVVALLTGQCYYPSMRTENKSLLALFSVRQERRIDYNLYLK